jgi:hypothetical protein
MSSVVVPKQKYPEWLTAKVDVDKLPNLDTSFITCWLDYIDNIKLKHLGTHRQMKFTYIDGRIGIVKQH